MQNGMMTALKLVDAWFLSMNVVILPADYPALSDAVAGVQLCC